jgi:hypothetical protein
VCVVTEGTQGQSRRASSDLDTALAQIDADIEGAHERAARAEAWVQEVERLAGHGEAERGGVRVQVDLSGSITGLSVSDAVAARGGQTVAHAVLAATVAAQADVRRRAAESGATTWGAGSASAQVFAAEVAADHETPDPGSAPPAPTRQGGQW